MAAITDNTIPVTRSAIRDEMIAFGIMTVLLAIVPLTGLYPFFVMQALCFALLACAFNLLIGYGGLLSFGHAMFLGTAGYVTAHLLKVGVVALPIWYWSNVWYWVTIPLPPLSPELAIFGGTLAAAGLGVITGVVAI